jgi:hypothetical protein
MILCKWDAPEVDPGESCVHLFARILSTSFSSVSIFSVCCYSSVSISMVLPLDFSILQQLVLSLDVSLLQKSELSLNVSVCLCHRKTHKGNRVIEH